MLIWTFEPAFYRFQCPADYVTDETLLWTDLEEEAPFVHPDVSPHANLRNGGKKSCVFIYPWTAELCGVKLHFHLKAARVGSSNSPTVSAGEVMIGNGWTGTSN